MIIFRFKRWLKRNFGSAPMAGERELWIENIGQSELRIMLEPWCDIYDIPPGQWAHLVSEFDDKFDEFHLQYDPDNYLGIYCPFETTVTLVEDRWGRRRKG